MGRGVRAPVPLCVVHFCTMFCPTRGLAEWQYAKVDDMLRTRKIHNLTQMSQLMQVMKAKTTCMLEDIGKPEFDIAPELSCVKIMRSTVEGKDGKPLTGCFPNVSG